MLQASRMWHSVEGYTIWFFTVSHPYMTPMSAHEELLKNEQVEDDHVIDLLPICQNIRQIGQEALDDGIIDEDGSDAIIVVEKMVAEAERATRYHTYEGAGG